MIQVAVRDVREGDRVRFTERGSLHIVQNVGPTDLDPDLLLVECADLAPFRMPGWVEIWVEMMFRTVHVPCLVHGGRMLIKHDHATGPVPVGLLCGACDGMSTDDIIEAMRKAGRSE